MARLRDAPTFTRYGDQISWKPFDKLKVSGPQNVGSELRYQICT